ncbi:MAG: dihydroorotate dehydrogenase electron transfer subunit [Candidatus Bathyarchaeia archaeon]
MSAYRIADNQQRTTRIIEVQNCGLDAKVFKFMDKRCAKAKPGQFLMLWIPGVDEIPLSVLGAQKNGMVSVFVKKVGEATRALHNMKVGDVIGVRGPFGNSFTSKKGKLLMVGGGTGVAPLLFLAGRLKKKAEKLIFVLGAKTREELYFLDELKEICVKEEFAATTEDGSYGLKGLATAPLDSIFSNGKIDMVYTCGPEPMMLKVFNLAEKHGADIEASLERLMRCAIGLCGSCTIGRYRVCQDGPVFRRSQLLEVKNEFGVSKRDFDGRKIPI